MILGDTREGDVYALFLPTAVNDTEDDEGVAELNDHFISCMATGKETWGDPFLLKAGDGPTVMWMFPERGFAQLMWGFYSLGFRFITPQGRGEFM